jgi:hypothetical protein
MASMPTVLAKLMTSGATLGVGVQQHAQQQLGVVRGMAVPVGAVGAQERAEVELVDHIAHEPGQMVGGQPVARVGGSRRSWSRSPRRKL